MRYLVAGLLGAGLLGLLMGCEGVELRTGGSRQLSRDPLGPLKPGTIVVPVGTQIRVRLCETLDSEQTHEGHRFATCVMENVRAGSATAAIPRGTTIHGYVANLQRVLNRTSMRLRFDVADLPDGRRVLLDAEPPDNSRLDMDDLARKGAHEAGKFAVQQGLSAATGGLLSPVWIYMRAKKVYGFVTKEARLILPKDSILTLELNRPTYIPPK